MKAVMIHTLINYMELIRIKHTKICPIYNEYIIGDKEIKNRIGCYRFICIHYRQLLQKAKQ